MFVGAMNFGASSAVECEKLLQISFFPLNILQEKI
jgi:hypothetical protein